MYHLHLHLQLEPSNELIQNGQPVRSHSEILFDIVGKSGGIVVARRREQNKTEMLSIQL